MSSHPDKNNSLPRPARRGRPRLGNSQERKTSLGKLQQAMDAHPVTAFLTYQEFLGAIYQHLKTEKPSYSYHQLAEDLGFSRTNVLWLVISGRRKLSTKSSELIATKLQLKGDHRRYFTLLVFHANLRDLTERETCFKDLLELRSRSLNSTNSQMLLEYYSEWYHPVIREMTGLDDFRTDAAWINKKLVSHISPLQIKNSLQLLERLGLIEFNKKDGRYRQAPGHILPDRQVEQLASVRFHQKMCDAARDALTRIPEKRREMNTLTISVSDDSISRIREILYHACEQILAVEAKVKDKSQVYQLNLHLFPFTCEERK